MGRCAELTLRLLRCGQEALGPMSSMIGWVFFPDTRHLSWSEARDVLASMPKPLFALPMLESGVIALWSAESSDNQVRETLAHNIRNQCAFYGDQLDGMRLAESDLVETPYGEFSLTVAEFRRWMQEYCINLIGVSLQPGPAPNSIRLCVRPPGGGRAPIGWITPRAHQRCDHSESPPDA